MNKLLAVIVILISVIVIVSSCAILVTTIFVDDNGHFSILGGKDSIITGFSTELTEMLKEDYELIITEDVVFVKGYYDNRFLDPALWIYFKVPEDQFNDLFIDYWTSSLSVGDQREYEASYNYCRPIDDPPSECAILYYRTSMDGYIDVLFVGLK